MKLVKSLGLALAAISLMGGAVSANAQGLTREQVRAELAEAVRNGDIIADGDTGRTLRELYPHRYPALEVAMGKTREQVRAELAEAVRTGDILANGDQGLTLRELYPHRYEMADAKAGAVREQEVSSIGASQLN